MPIWVLSILLHGKPKRALRPTQCFRCTWEPLLDLIDRVPDELWNEVHDIVQETGIKTIPKEKKCKKAKWLSEEALQIAVKRREAKAKEERKDMPI